MYTAIGPSMYPVIRAGDGINFEKYERSTSVKRGDVIIYSDPTLNLNIIHRVVKYKDSYFITRGDYNTHYDLTKLTFENIIGKVVSIKRGDKRIYLSNGITGLFLHKIMILRMHFSSFFLSPLRFVSNIIAGMRFLKVCHNLFTTSIIAVKQGDESTEFLLFKGKVIGKQIKDSQFRCWKIKFPYKFFIDIDKLN